MRMMVIGGAGFLGSHLVDRLLAEQHSVDAVDDLSSGSLANLSSARSLGGDLKISHLDASTADFASLVAMREPEIIYHLGWLPPGRSDVREVGRGIQVTLTALDAARTNGVGKVIACLPASAVYGEVPAREVPVKERPFAPAGVVGVAAAMGADLLRVHRENFGIEFTALAMTNVYGPRQRADGGVVAAFAAALDGGTSPVIHGDGRQSRDFLYVDDAVDALVRAATRGSGLVVNIGTGTLTQVRDLWAAMAGPGAPSPKPGPARRPDDVTRFAVSATRARIHLSWAAWTDLATGLRSLR